MKILFSLLAVSLFVGCSTNSGTNSRTGKSNANQLNHDAQYKLGPDAQPHPGVPRGALIQMSPFTNSSVFPDTVRDWWVYVPKQYDSSKPACLMVFQDGSSYVNMGTFQHSGIRSLEFT